MREHAAEALLLVGLAAYFPALMAALWWVGSGALSSLLALAL